MSLAQTIRKYALQNAVKHEGKCNPGNVLGKVLGENPEYKNKAKEVQQEVKEISEHVNAMSLDDQKKELLRIAPELLEEKSGEKKEILVQSDRMEIYYKYASKLIEELHAYVCTCPQEMFQENSKKGIPCECRDRGRHENEKLWGQMLNGELEEGDAVVRLKTDINHPNPAMRDFPLLRINESEHSRQGRKYRVWPLLNFAVAIDDHDMALTHVLRGKDHFDNTKRQKYIFDYLGWTHPEYIHIGR